MAKPPPTLVKPTLDKDLDKIAYAEAAAQQVWRGALPVGIGLIFLILATLFAGFYASNQPGAIVVITAAAVGAYMAMNIGANDVTNNVGAAVGSKAITMTTALIVDAITPAD